MPRFDEAWMGQGQLDMLGTLAAQTNVLDGECIEFGVWQGRSAVPIANAVAPATLHLVDHWQGDNLCPEAIAKGECIRPELVERDNKGICIANMDEATAGNYKVWEMDWRDFIKQWDKPVRFVHLDAGHTEDEATGNIEAIVPFMVPGAVLAGDDYDWPGVQATVNRLYPGANVLWNKLWWVIL